jgi:hypothetical protein
MNGTWSAFNGGTALLIGPAPSGGLVTSMRPAWTSPPPPQSSVYTGALTTPGALAIPTSMGPMAGVPSGHGWLLVPSGSWMWTMSFTVPPLPAH